MIKALLIEDEEPVRVLIKEMMEDIDRDIVILAECESVDEAVKAIADIGPDIIFLDIMLIGGTAFDLLERLDSYPFETIFITSYDKYALEAFKYAAIGYVLKPIDENELKASVANARKRVLDKAGSNIELLMNLVNKKTKSDVNTIAVPTQEGFVFIIPSNILRCEASGVYTKIFLTDNSHLLSSYNLAQFKHILPSDQFYQIQKSHLISLSHINRYNSRESVVEMTNGDSIPVSKKIKAEFLGMFKRPGR